jgi:putative inorganic carbon (HCO3(-)) transporter
MLLSHTLFAKITERASSIKKPFAWVSFCYLSAVLLCAAVYAWSGSSGVPTFVLGAALAPLAIYGMVRAPLIFPFCAYILVLPFDSISSLGSGGTLAKLVGVLTAAALLLRVIRRGLVMKVPAAVVGWSLLLLWMGVSTFWALNLSDATYYFQQYASLIALFVLLSIVAVSRFELNAILASTLVAGVLSAGYDAYLYHSGQSLVAANAGVTRVLIVVGDAQIDPNALASALVLPTAISIYWLFNSRYAVLSMAMIPALAILLLGFSASGSRGGFIQLGLFFFYLIIRSRHRMWLGVLMLTAIATTLAANPGLPARFADAEQDGGAGRRDIWNIGIHALRHYWITGAGVGNFANAFDREYINVYSHYVLGWHWVAHNVPLQIATELGVIGLAVFAIAVYFQFRSLRNVEIGDTAGVELRLVLEGAFLGVMTSGLSISNLNLKYVWLAFSVMMVYRGYLMSGARLVAPARHPEPGLRPWWQGAPIALERDRVRAVGVGRVKKS